MNCPRLMDNAFPTLGTCGRPLRLTVTHEYDLAEADAVTAITSKPVEQEAVVRCRGGGHVLARATTRTEALQILLRDQEGSDR